MNEMNTFEFVVAEKAEGSRKAKKALGRAGLLTIVIGFVIVCFAINAPMLAILPLSLLGIVLYFWKIFNVELEYSMTSGIMTFSRIYGGIRRRKVLDLTIKEMHEIAPVTAETAAHLQASDVEKSYLFASSSTAIDMYYATFELDGKRCVVYFEATEKALKILRYYNPATVVTAVSR